MELLIALAVYVISVVASFYSILWAMDLSGLHKISRGDVGMTMLVSAIPGVNIVFAFIWVLTGLFIQLTNGRRPGFINRFVDRYTR